MVVRAFAIGLWSFVKVSDRLTIMRSPRMIAVQTFSCHLEPALL
jgi:hypothetical protein